MALSGFVGEPTPPGAINARPNFLRAPLLDQGAWPKGAGDLISTAADMARWNIALMSNRVIAAPLLEAMLMPVATTHGFQPYHDCKYAMGWYVCDRLGYRLHQHDGIISGFMASNAIGRTKDGSSMSVIVLANSDATIILSRWRVALSKSVARYTSHSISTLVKDILRFNTLRYLSKTGHGRLDQPHEVEPLAFISPASRRGRLRPSQQQRR